MKRIISLVFVMLMAQSSILFAQNNMYQGQEMYPPYESTRDYEARPHTIPKGPYLDTCFQVTMVCGTLRAYCLNKQGHASVAKLKEADQCMGVIYNDNGQLVCRPVTNRK